MASHNIMPLKKYRKMIAGVAKDLCYDEKVIDKILHAESVDEIETIMRTERMRSS